MSGLLKSNVQLGDSATATNNFTLTVPTVPDGTAKLARGNAGSTTQDVMTVDVNGKVAFPQNVQIFNAYCANQTMGWGVENTFTSWVQSTTVGSFTFDTSNGYVTPLVSGWYLVIGLVSLAGDGVGSDVGIFARLTNESAANLATVIQATPSGTNYPMVQVSQVIYFNGTTSKIKTVGRKTLTPNATNVSATIQLTLIAKA